MKKEMFKLCSSVVAILAITACSNNGGGNTSNQNNSNSIDDNDPSIVTFKSAEEIFKGLDDVIGGTVYCSNDSSEVEFAKDAEYLYTKEKADGKETEELSRFLTYGTMVYSRDDYDYYDSLNVYEYNDYGAMMITHYAEFANMKLRFESANKITFLDRECTEYTVKEFYDYEYETMRPFSGTIVVDNASGAFLKSDLNYEYHVEGQEVKKNTKTEFKSLKTKSEVELVLKEQKTKVKVSECNSEVTKLFGFETTIDYPNLPINHAEIEYNEDEVSKYVCVYEDRTCMGNDSYINQFEAFSNSFFKAGFSNMNVSKDESKVELVEKTFEELVTRDMTDDYVMLDFDVYKVIETKTTRIQTALAIMDGYAQIMLSITR